MAVCPEVRTIYEETIKEFTFRDSDGITIPKNVRENAYTLAIDIVIVSTRREVYKNYGSSPAEGFYGNATLVMQDMCEIKIPVKMPRQRLYYGRVAEAFIHWQTLVDWSYFQAYMTAIGESLVSLGTALGAGFVPATNCCPLPDRSWIELPLREVYFNCPSGTQYKIEVSWYKALEIVDACGNIRDPTSKMIDGDKDNGLPANGTQPNVAPDSQDPFANLPLPTSDAEQAGFSNSKISNMDNTDPSNIPMIPDPVGTLYWVKVINIRKRPSFPQGCTNTRTETAYISVLKESQIVSITINNTFTNPCTNATDHGYNLTLTGGEPLDIGQNDGGAPSVTFGRGLVKPANTDVYSL